MRRTWSRDAVVSALAARQQDGLSLEYTVVYAEDRSLVWAAGRYFGKGGWFKALRKIGVRSKRKHQSWSAEKVVSTIHRIYKKTGRINSNFTQVNHPSLYQRALFYFGSWKKAIEAAGIDYESVRAVRAFVKWSKRKILSEIRKRKSSGNLRRGSIGTEDDRRLYHAAQRHFGKNGWRKALAAVRLKPLASPRRVKWTKKMVAAEIHALHETREKLPAVFLEHHGYWGLITAARHLFGSWKNAITYARIDYEKVRARRPLKWTRETVIKEINRLEKQGVRLSHKAIRETRCDLLGAAIARFGSWSQAVEAAGIDYRQHALIWSTKAWLRSLSGKDVKRIERRALNLSQRGFK